jgi:hypothetical protein
MRGNEGGISMAWSCEGVIQGRNEVRDKLESRMQDVFPTNERIRLQNLGLQCPSLHENNGLSK